MITISTMTMACSTAAAGRPEITCTILNSKSVPDGMDANAICAQFRDTFAAAIAANGSKPEGQIKAAIAFTGHGEITADLIEVRSSSEVRHPQVAVAIFDRAMNKNDVGQLAKDAAALFRR